MTTEELKNRVRELEKGLMCLLERFQAEACCRISRVRVIDEGPNSYDQEVRVRVATPHQGIKSKRAGLERDIKELFVAFETTTDFRVIEVHGLYDNEGPHIILDPLPYPQRYSTSSIGASLLESKVH